MAELASLRTRLTARMNDIECCISSRKARAEDHEQATIISARTGEAGTPAPLGESALPPVDCRDLRGPEAGPCAQLPRSTASGDPRDADCHPKSPRLSYCKNARMLPRNTESVTEFTRRTAILRSCLLRISREPAFATEFQFATRSSGLCLQALLGTSRAGLPHIRGVHGGRAWIAGPGMPRAARHKCVRPLQGKTPAQDAVLELR